MKMYFRDRHSEFCWPLSEIKDQIRNEGLSEAVVIQAVPDRSSGMFWCRHFAEIGYSSESCGRHCAEYKPRNGRSGICADNSSPYNHGNEVLIKV